MKILKNLGKILAMAFEDDGFVHGFENAAFEKKNYDKEIAENTAKLSKALEQMSQDLREVGN